MKKKLLLPLLFWSFFGFSQQKQFTINWEEPITLETSTDQIVVPAFDREHFNFTYKSGLVYFATWDENSAIDEGSVELNQVSYTNLTTADLKQLPLSTIPEAPIVKLRNSVDRGDVSAYLEISPIIKDGGIYKKITAFTIDYEFGSLSRSAQSTQEITNSVLSTGTWHRFYVDKTGVFRLTRSFLNAIGVNTNVDPRTIKIYGNGGAMLPVANNEFYPFDLTENAIRVIGEEDGVFNNDDYIL